MATESSPRQPLVKLMLTHYRYMYMYLGVSHLFIFSFEK